VPIHVAILQQPYLNLILQGRKTIESRLTIRPLPPFNAIAPGERIFLKQSAGPFLATALAADVLFFDGLTRSKIVELKRRFNGEVCGDAAFWEWKRDSRFATFIRLAKVQPITVGPAMQPSRGPAWFVLPDHLAPRVPASFDVKLTAGAIKNHYIRIPRRLHTFDAKHYGGKTLAEVGEPIVLVLPDGTRIATDIVNNQMVRWRGWLPWFRAQQMLPGAAVRFVERDDGGYGVTFLKARALSSPPS